jgi:hypothetical protein
MMNENKSVRVVVARDVIVRGGLSRGESILARFELDWAFYEVLASGKCDRVQRMANLGIHSGLGAESRTANPATLRRDISLASVPEALMLIP